jgi:competence protein ComFC
MTESRRIYYFYRLIWTGLDLVFPPTCSGCGKPGYRWCDDCQRNIVLISKPYCDFCGIPLHGKASLCLDCQRERPRYRILRSWSTFDPPVQNALHRLKYRHDIGLGDALAVQLSGYVSNLNWPINLVVPVPLGKRRLYERGYNQVGLIARPLSLSMNIAYAPDALTRGRETRSQVGLSKFERHANVFGAFHAKQSRVNGRTALLIDDVATTGSTLSSCAEALYAAGAQDVFAVTVARALIHHNLRIA